jgi:hypothetical protein
VQTWVTRLLLATYGSPAGNQAGLRPLHALTICIRLGESYQKVHRRLLKFIGLLFLLLFFLPLSLRAALYLFDDQTPSDYSYDVGTADMSSIGLLQPAESHPAARVLIMSVPMSGKRGQFLTHSWVVLKPENARSWRCTWLCQPGWHWRTERAWLGNRPTLNRYPPDGRWFGRSPVVIADIEGTTAAAAIGKINGVIESYETLAGHYRFWPGPNSNTFVAAVVRAAPELRASLPPTAIGKDFRPGVFLGLNYGQPDRSRSRPAGSSWFESRLDRGVGDQFVWFRRRSRPTSASSQAAGLRTDRCWT